MGCLRVMAGSLTTHVELGTRESAGYAELVVSLIAGLLPGAVAMLFCASILQSPIFSPYMHQAQRVMATDCQAPPGGIICLQRTLRRHTPYLCLLTLIVARAC